MRRNRWARTPKPLPHAFCGCRQLPEFESTLLPQQVESGCGRSESVCGDSDAKKRKGKVEDCIFESETPTGDQSGGHPQIEVMSRSFRGFLHRHGERAQGDRSER